MQPGRRVGRGNHMTWSQSLLGPFCYTHYTIKVCNEVEMRAAAVKTMWITFHVAHVVLCISAEFTQKGCWADFLRLPELLSKLAGVMKHLNIGFHYYNSQEEGKLEADFFFRILPDCWHRFLKPKGNCLWITAIWFQVIASRGSFFFHLIGSEGFFMPSPILCLKQYHPWIISL